MLSPHCSTVPCFLLSRVKPATSVLLQSQQGSIGVGLVPKRSDWPITNNIPYVQRPPTHSRPPPMSTREAATPAFTTTETFGKFGSSMMRVDVHSGLTSRQPAPASSSIPSTPASTSSESVTCASKTVLPDSPLQRGGRYQGYGVWYGERLGRRGQLTTSTLARDLAPTHMSPQRRMRAPAPIPTSH